jgi:hypothetical protein
MTEDAWTEVAMLADDVEADLMRGFLESEGIEARIDNRKFHMEPVNFGDLTGVRVLTHTEDSERARGLLEKRERDFGRMQDSGDATSILTDSGPEKAPEDPSE